MVPTTGISTRGSVWSRVNSCCARSTIITAAVSPRGCTASSTMADSWSPMARCAVSITCASTPAHAASGTLLIDKTSRRTYRRPHRVVRLPSRRLRVRDLRTRPGGWRRSAGHGGSAPAGRKLGDVSAPFKSGAQCDVSGNRGPASGRLTARSQLLAPFPLLTATLCRERTSGSASTATSHLIRPCSGQPIASRGGGYRPCPHAP
jgi:hypothetical protein